MKATPITSEGVILPASACAAIRHILMRDLAACRRDRIPVAPEIVDAVEMIDNIGAWFEAKRVSDVSPDVSALESPRCEVVELRSMTVSHAAAELKVSEQAVTGLLRRGALLGEQQADRSWRVNAESVAARKESTCQH